MECDVFPETSYAHGSAPPAEPFCFFNTYVKYGTINKNDERMIVMSHSPDCIFCKIINGDIPSAKVYESEDVLAFLDLTQVTEGHTLVIPKKHKQNIYELDSDTASKLFEAVPEIANALKTNFAPEGMNILNNNEAIAGQSVFHYHLHLIPRYGKGDGFGAVWKTHESEYDADKLQKLAEGIRSQFN